MLSRLTALATLAATLAATLLPALPAQAKDRYSGVNLIRGTVLSAGRADPRGDSMATDDLDTGYYLDANYSSVLINGGLGIKDFSGESVGNAYVGVGLGRLIQMQLGYGAEGSLGRVRSDLNIRSLFSLVTQKRQDPREKTLADRITFSYSLERYNDKESEHFDNATIGIGLLYEWPEF